MRKIIAIIFLMSLFAMSANAEEVNFVQNLETGECTFSGVIKEARYNNMISVKILDSENNIEHISYADTDFYGNFSYSFSMPQDAGTDDYTVKIGAANLEEPVTDTFSYINKGEVDQLIENIKGVSEENGADTAADDILTLIDGKLRLLGVDDSDYSKLSPTQKKKIAQEILANRTDYASITSSAKRGFLVQRLNVAETSSINTILEGNKDVFKIEEALLYQKYTRLQNKTRFNEIFDTYTFNEMQDCLTAFNEATLISSIEVSQPGEITKIFEDFKTVFPFSLETYNNSNKTKTAYALAGKTINSMSELDEMIKTIYSQQIIIPNGGGNSSGGGGSSSGSKKGNIVVGSTQGEVLMPKGFSDLDSCEWAKEAINALTDKGIVSGVASDRFEPQRNITREEFVKIVISALELFDENYRDCGFLDIDKSSWAYPYVSKAYELGIISGMDDENFGLGKYITRQDMAVIIVRALQVKESKVDKVKENKGFNDAENISDYAVNSVNMLVEGGIINGFEDNTFRPQMPATRAQSAVMLYNIIK